MFGLPFFVQMATVGLAQVASADTLQQAQKFHNWFDQNRESFGRCEITFETGNYILCDGTPVPKKTLKKLFRLKPKALIQFFQDDGWDVEVLCQQGTKKSANDLFGFACKEKTKYPDFDKAQSLQGQFRPKTKTILLKSDALFGSAVHEYIHALQFQSTATIAGKRYKHERSKVQLALEKQMDQVVQKSSTSGVSAADLKKSLSEMQELAEVMSRFGLAQDLIDERGIFQLYLKYGHEFGISAADRRLAQKNMGFICARTDLKNILPATQCDIKKLKPHYLGVEEIILEVRPKPSMQKVDQFLANLPEVGSMNLKDKLIRLRKYIFADLAISADNSYLSRNQKDNILPDTTLELKKAHCVGLSTLFLLALESWGVNAHLVRIPEHVYVRVCEESTCYNIETLKKGELVGDSFYKESGYLSALQEKGPYGDRTTPSALKGSIYLSLGFIANGAQQVGLAEYFYKRSTEFSPRYPDSYSNLAALYFKLNRRREGFDQLNKALRKDPHHQPSLVNKAILERTVAQVAKKPTQGGYIVLDKAIAVNPMAPMPLSVKAQWLMEDGSNEELAARLELAGVQSKNCPNLKRIHQLKKDSKKLPKSQLEAVEITEKLRIEHCL